MKIGELANRVMVDALICIERLAFKANRWAEARLFDMGLERVRGRTDKSAWRGRLVRREP